MKSRGPRQAPGSPQYPGLCLASSPVSAGSVPTGPCHATGPGVALGQPRWCRSPGRARRRGERSGRRNRLTGPVPRPCSPERAGLRACVRGSWHPRCPRPAAGAGSSLAFGSGAADPPPLLRQPPEPQSRARRRQTEGPGSCRSPARCPHPGTSIINYQANYIDNLILYLLLPSFQIWSSIFTRA